MTLLLDLILLKRGVYRHLLFNRGAPPKRESGAAAVSRLTESSVEEREYVSHAGKVDNIHDKSLGLEKEEDCVRVRYDFDYG